MPTKRKVRVAVPPATPYPDDAPLMSYNGEGKYAFPLRNMFRWAVVENYLQATGWVNAAEKDVRLVMDSKPVSGYFKTGTDPVKNLVRAVEQRDLCVATLRLDNEAHYMRGTVPIGLDGNPASVTEFERNHAHT